MIRRDDIAPDAKDGAEAPEQKPVPSAIPTKAERRAALPPELQGDPQVQLPPKLPLQVWRPAQSNIPNERAERDLLKRAAEELCEERGLVPPLAMTELRELAVELCEETGVGQGYVDYTAVLVSNASWREALAQVPYERRLLLIPKCLRVEEHCPAPFDEFGLLCKECGLCSIQDFTAEAERLGYAVLVAEGSAIVRSMIDTGKIEAIVGVSCLNVLEKSFPHMEAGAIPGIAIPLLQDDCINTNVDEDLVWDIIHLTSEDRTYRMDLDALREDVKTWFSPAELERLMGPAASESDRIGREWLARDGKRWRPYLTACVVMAHAWEQMEGDVEPQVTDDLRRLCIAVECFHKASLVHDDIEDEDEGRYGEPTLHVEHGLPVALNVGDLLLGEGYRLLTELEVPGDVRARMLAEASRGHLSLCRGQGAELLWTRAPAPLTSLQVLDIFRQKTAPAFEVALLLGAHFAGVDAEEEGCLREYSESLGIAYQIQDDLDDHTGTSDSDDVADVRPSLLLSIASKLARGEEAELVEALWHRQRTEEAEAFRTIAETCGSVKKARELRDAYEAQAVRSLRVLQNPTLKGLLRRVIGKIFGDKLVIEGYCGEFEARNAAGRASGAPAAR